MSGTINGTVYNSSGDVANFDVKVTWEESDVSVSDNTSKVSCKLQYRRTTAYDTKGTISGKLTINGVSTTYSKYVTIPASGAWVTVCTASTVIAHSNDGSKSITIKATGGISGTTLDHTTLSGTATLTTIARASVPTLSASSIYMRDDSITITTNRASTSFTHTLKYSFGGSTGTIATDVANTRTWTPPLSLAAKIPSATAGICTITCYTYSGTKLIGSKQVSFTLKVPTDVKPTVSISASEAVSGLAAKFGAYVQNKSKLAVSITATPPKSGSTELASIKTYSTKVNGVTYSASSFTTGVLTASGTISTTVTDSRGRTATASLAYTVVAYSAPKISSIKAIRVNDLGIEDNDGTRLKLKTAWNISSINSLNDHTYKVEYKEAMQGDESYVKLASGSANYSYNSEMSFLTQAEFDTDTTYYIRLTITDYFGSSDTSDILSTSYTLLDFNASGKGMAVGKVSEKDGFEVAMPMFFNGDDKTVQEQLSAIATPQGRNLIPFPYSNSTKTHRGITFTVNPDGNITANGTASGGNAYIDIAVPEDELKLSPGFYSLSGCPEADGASMWLGIAEAPVIHAGSYAPSGYDTGSGYILQLPDTSHQYVYLQCIISNGKTVNNIVFKPMLEEGTIAHAYEPTPESNATLKKAVDNIGTVLTASESERQTLAGGSWEIAKSLEIGVGTWIITGQLTFNALSSSVAGRIGISLAADGRYSDSAMNRMTSADNSHDEALNVTRICTATELTTVSLSAFTSVARDISKIYINAIKIA